VSARLRLDGLTIDTVIGIRSWERRVRQRLLLDLELDVDIGPAARSDRIEDALDYSALAARVRALAAKADARLIEALAERLAAAILAEYPTPRVRLVLTKPGAVAGASVRLEIERQREA